VTEVNAHLALAHVENRIAAIEAELEQIRQFIQYCNKECNAQSAQARKPV
jgi:cob(I)alamin adenosyltransferase